MLKNRTLWIIIVIIILIALGFWGNKKGWFASQTASKDWQAVFLTNGQVYFGHTVGNTDGQYVTLKDIYYLQVQGALQPKTDQNTTPQIQLVKLGSELHGPKDQMKINRDSILFTESLKGDGKVVQAIDKYIKEGPDKSTITPSPTETSSPSPTKK